MKQFFIGLYLCMSASISWAENDNLGLPPLVISAYFPQSEAKIRLGKRLFNDKRLSLDGTISCASCHQLTKGLADGLKVAVGIKQQQGFRNTPTLINSAFNTSFFLDGRAKSLEEQSLGPLLNPVEHGLKNLQHLVALVKSDPVYQNQFFHIFKRKRITVDTISQALASYERTLIAGNSRFDQYLFARNRAALSASESRGMRLFRRKGNCANCHEISGLTALFTDNRFYNLGVGFQRVNSNIDDFVEQLRDGHTAGEYDFSDAQRIELGRFNATNVIADIGAFRTPTLRNIALTAPYMHDGSLETLEEVVEYYNKGGHKNRFLDAAIFPLLFTEQEQKDLVAFLKSLTSARYENSFTNHKVIP